MEQIGMKSQSYKLSPELNEGLVKYGEDNNLSPISIIEELVEDFLCHKDYLSAEIEEIPTKIEKIKNANYRKDVNSYRIRKRIQGKREEFGATKSPRIAKDLVAFLESEGWNLKYSVNNTGLNGEDQINFLLNEMENQKENKNGVKDEL